MNPTIIILSSRKEGITHDRCIEYLEQEHSPLVTELPALKRFTTSIPLAPERVGHPLDPGGTGYDVMAQLQFESLEDLQAAFDSTEGQRVLQDAQNFINYDKTIMVAIADETLRYQSVPPNL